MPKDNKQKIKLLYLMEVLRQETDEQHPMSTNQICKRLGEQGISCERRTVGMDMKVLNDYGYEIMSKMVGHEKAYYIDDRSFSVPEIKILMDAVQAAKFITPGKSAALIEKLAALGGSHQAEILKGNIVCFDTRKHTNEMIFYSVQALEDAIREHKKASFLYFDLNEKREKVYRRNGERYIVDPMSLVYNEDFYYLLSFNSKHEAITTYRVDRMERVQVEAESVCPKAVVGGADIHEYTSQVFKMYNGVPQKVTLEFDDILIGAVYDRFGEDISEELRQHENATTETHLVGQVHCAASCAAFFLSKGGSEGKRHFAVVSQRIKPFRFKENTNRWFERGQHSNISDAVIDVSRKAGDAFRYDQVQLMLLAVLNHFDKGFPVLE